MVIMTFVLLSHFPKYVISVHFSMKLNFQGIETYSITIQCNNNMILTNELMDCKQLLNGKVHNLKKKKKNLI